MCEICSKLTIKTPDVFIVNFEHILHLVLFFPLLTLSRQMPAGNFQLNDFFLMCPFDTRENITKPAHKYLNKPAAKSCRFVYIRMT